MKSKDDLSQVVPNELVVDYILEHNLYEFKKLNGAAVLPVVSKPCTAVIYSWCGILIES